MIGRPRLRPRQGEAGIPSRRLGTSCPGAPQVWRRTGRGFSRLQERGEKEKLFKPSRDATLDKAKEPLPGDDTTRNTKIAFRKERGKTPVVVQVGYRSFDRQWAIADSRLWHAPRPPLWAARRPGQVFVVEQHSQVIREGPGIVFTHLIPDMHYFKGSEGGRTLPLLHPGERPNLSVGLLSALSTLVGSELLSDNITAHDMLAYIAAVVAHPAYTATFADELTTPGIRVPITADPQLWGEAVELGRDVLWAHTYGQTYVDPDLGRPAGDVRFPPGNPDRILNQQSVTGIPTELVFDEARHLVVLDSGAWGPVRREVFDYVVSGINVLKSWFKYRKADPGGRKASPLDDIHVDTWPAEWSVELTDLLSVLTRLVQAEPAQAELVGRILAAPILTRDVLTEHGVQWPRSPADRKPDYHSVDDATSERDDGTLGF